MSTPLVSIITINYNNAEGLSKTFNSVFEQTFSDWEYLVIDGGSTDASTTLIKNNEARLNYWVSEADDGIFHAMNKGIEKARGQYFLFLNSGDQLNGPDILAQFIDHPKFQGDVIYGDYLFEKGAKKYPDSLYPAYFIKTSLPHQSTLFKHTVFEQLGGYDLNFPMSADRAFYIKAYLSGHFEFVHIPLYLTLFDLTGISNDPLQKQRKNKEDERMLKHSYGDQYEDMVAVIEAEREAARIPKYSVKGILKRLKKRLKDL